MLESGVAVALVKFYLVIGVLSLLFASRRCPLPVNRWLGRILFLPTLPFFAVKSFFRGRWYDRVDDTLILGSVPIPTRGFLSELRGKHNVSVIINMMDEYPGLTPLYAQYDMAQRRFPTVDHEEPDLGVILAVVAEIEACRQQRKVVYIHCKAGHGRSAAVAFCWMLKTRPERSVLDVQRDLLAIRHVRKTLYKQTNIMRFIEMVRVQ